MADLVLGLATSHTPLLSLPPEMWPAYAKGDERNPELSLPAQRLRDVLPAGEPSRCSRGQVPLRRRRSPSSSRPPASRRALDTLADHAAGRRAGHHRHHQRRPGRVVLRAQHAALRRLLGRQRAADPADRRAEAPPRWPRRSPAATATCPWTCRSPATSAATWSSTCATTTSTWRTSPTCSSRTAARSPAATRRLTASST